MLLYICAKYNLGYERILLWMNMHCVKQKDFYVIILYLLMIYCINKRCFFKKLVNMTLRLVNRIYFIFLFSRKYHLLVFLEIISNAEKEEKSIHYSARSWQLRAAAYSHCKLFDQAKQYYHVSFHYFLPTWICYI